MTWGQRALVFSDSLGPGMMAPVLSLVLLAHGCGLTQLGLALGCYSCAVLLLELPSGLISDLFGRKKVYYLSCAANALSALLVLFVHSLPLMLVAMALQGAGRAFSSGTVDALLLDRAAEQGSQALQKTTAQLTVWQCAGIAVGALLGGLMPAFQGYAAHLTARTALAVALIALAKALLPPETQKANARPRLFAHMAQGAKLVAGSPTLALLLALTAAGALPLVLTETYWQSALLALPRPGNQAMLGLLCTLGFFATMAGSFIMGRNMAAGQGKRFLCYAVLLVLRAGALVLLAAQKSALGFAGAYLLGYLALGAFNIPEQTLLNQAVPSAFRASMLSLYSLAVQLGGMVASMASSPLVGQLGIQGVWRVGAGAALGLMGLVVLAALLRRSFARGANPASTWPPSP